MYKISVIVPIYNVQDYLKRSIESLLNQTYKNLEIILVDDGSTDNSGKIAEGYKKVDERVKVYHKKNGGLSDARNYGINKATGDYVLYVDSDDWLDLDMINIMVEKVKEYEADIVQVGFYYAYEDHQLYDNRYYNEDDEDIVLDRESLMKELVINERVKNFAWGKLYKTELVKDILFEKGAKFEDVYWAHQVMHRVNKYVIVHKPMVYYLQRGESITGTYNVRNTEIIKGLLERHMFIRKNYNHLLNESYKTILNTCFVHYDLLINMDDKSSAQIYSDKIKDYIYKNSKKFEDALVDNKYMANQLKFFLINPNLRNMYIFFNKVLMKLKIKKSEPSLKRIELNE